MMEGKLPPLFFLLIAVMHFASCVSERNNPFGFRLNGELENPDHSEELENSEFSLGEKNFGKRQSFFGENGRGMNNLNVPNNQEGYTENREFMTRRNNFSEGENERFPESYNERNKPFGQGFENSRDVEGMRPGQMFRGRQDSLVRYDWEKREQESQRVNEERNFNQFGEPRNENNFERLTMPATNQEEQRNLNQYSETRGENNYDRRVTSSVVQEEQTNLNQFHNPFVEPRNDDYQRQPMPVLNPEQRNLNQYSIQFGEPRKENNYDRPVINQEQRNFNQFTQSSNGNNFDRRLSMAAVNQEEQRNFNKYSNQYSEARTENNYDRSPFPVYNQEEQRGFNNYNNEGMVRSMHSRYPTMDYNGGMRGGYRRSDYYDRDKGLVINFNTDCQGSSKPYHGHQLMQKVIFTPKSYINAQSEVPSYQIPGESLITTNQMTGPLYYL